MAKTIKQRILEQRKAESKTNADSVEQLQTEKYNYVTPATDPNQRRANAARKRGVTEDEQYCIEDKCG